MNLRRAETLADRNRGVLQRLSQISMQGAKAGAKFAARMSTKQDRQQIPLGPDPFTSVAAAHGQLLKDTIHPTLCCWARQRLDLVTSEDVLQLQLAVFLSLLLWRPTPR